MPYSMPTEPLCHPHPGSLFSPCIKKIVKPILVNLFYAQCLQSVWPALRPSELPDWLLEIWGFLWWKVNQKKGCCEGNQKAKYSSCSLKKNPTAACCCECSANSWIEQLRFLHDLHSPLPCLRLLLEEIASHCLLARHSMSPEQWTEHIQSSIKCRKGYHHFWILRCEPVERTFLLRFLSAFPRPRHQ